MDPSSLLQRLIRTGVLSTAQARWVEAQASAGPETVEDVLRRHGLARTEDLGEPPPSGRDLIAVAAGQRRCDRMLETIFELCLRRGVIDHEEYLERLAEAERDPEK